MTRTTLAALTAAALWSIQAPTPAAAATGLEQLQLLSDAFAELSESVKPAVVAVKTEKEMVRIEPEGRPGPPFEDFFPFRQPEGGLQKGLGSGVIISADGHILTNNHVISGGWRPTDSPADHIRVELSDGRIFDPRIVGRDPGTDLAVLKIEANEDLPFLAFGDSDQLDVGEWVVAVGNPFGQLHTVTSGIVSALGRGPRVSEYEDYIQTDAAINPGNSGGALIDLSGELVGINTAIASRSGGYQGIGFAIPVNLARKVMDQLVEHGEVRRGMLGIYMGEINSDLSASLDLDSRKGALVTEVMEDTPAEEAGLKAYDVIVAVDDVPTDGPAALKSYIAHQPPGTEVQLTVLRDGRKRTVTAELAPLERERLASTREEPRGQEKLGLAVRELTEEVAHRLGFSEEEGVVISRVQRGSPAALAGLRRGDLIIEIDREPVGSVREYREAIEEADGRALLLIRRKVREGTLTDIVSLRIPQ